MNFIENASPKKRAEGILLTAFIFFAFFCAAAAAAQREDDIGVRPGFGRDATRIGLFAGLSVGVANLFEK